MPSPRAMKISYELNPPKLVRRRMFDAAQLQTDIDEMTHRASQLAGIIWGIHLTDSVLGTPRLSGVTAASYIQKAIGANTLALSCSLRSRDRNFTSLSQAASDAILVGIDSLLILLGDNPSDSPGNPGLMPTEALVMLREQGYDTKIKLDLSFPARIKDCSATSMQKKLDARPHSFVTQSISSISELGEIVDLAKQYGTKVAAVVMVPSEKNRQSASIIGLDWSGYEKNVVDFVKQASLIADRVLITSPNSFKSGVEILHQLK